MATKDPSGPRVAVIVGPYLSGKTALLESILLATGAIGRKGSSKEGYAVGDGTKEAKDRQMSTEVNIASTTYLDEPWTFLDCPGSIELIQEPINTLTVADTAIVVCEPDDDAAQPGPQVFKVGAQGQYGHYLGGGDDVEPGLSNRCVVRTAQAGGDLAQRSLLHVGDAP